MECKQFENRLIDYLEDSCSPSLKLAMADHLESCSSCLAKYHYIKDMYGILDIEKEIEVPPFLMTRIEGRMEKGVEKRTNIRWVPAFAATLVMGLFFGFLVSTITMSPQKMNYSERELAYFFNEMQIEHVESTLLSD